MKRSWLGVLLVALAGIGAGVAGNRYFPLDPPRYGAARTAARNGDFLPLAEAERLWRRGGALFLDAREPADYAAGHIGGALNLPAQSFAEHFGEVLPGLTPAAELVLYCDGPECDLSQSLRDELGRLGYTNTHLLFNGWTAWREAGLATATATAGSP